MFGNLGGWTGFILLVVVLVLIAGPKLPQFAKSIGQSAQIFRHEVNKTHAEPGQDAHSTEGLGKSEQPAHSTQPEQGMGVRANTTDTKEPNTL